MPDWTYPTLGPIALIPTNLRPKKVWSHFCAYDEHWEKISSGDVRALLVSVEVVAGISREGNAVLPSLDEPTWRATRAALHLAHDEGYAPAYATEMSSRDTRWGSCKSDSRRHIAATPRGVFIVVQLDCPSWVITAYRPHPPLRDVEWDESDFVRQAHQKFEREVQMSQGTMVQHVMENLQRASATPLTSVKGAWWLALAVARGRLFADQEGMLELLAGAEGGVASIPPSILTQLSRSIDWVGLLDKVTEGLKDERSEELEATLDLVEEALLVGSVIGEIDSVESFCEDVVDLVAWLPPEWTHLGLKGAERCRQFPEESAPARVWYAIAEAGIGGVIRATAPRIQVSATLLDRLLPSQREQGTVFDQVAELAARGTRQLQEWVQATLDAVTVRRPSPVLGSSVPAVTWEVYARATVGARFVRVFVVDREAQEGIEVTESFRSDGVLWELSPTDDEAQLVLLAGDLPIIGDTLARVLESVSSREDICAATLRLIPPR